MLVAGSPAVFPSLATGLPERSVLRASKRIIIIGWSGREGGTTVDDHGNYGGRGYECGYQGCLCRRLSPAPDMRCSSFSAVCSGAGLSAHTRCTNLNNSLHLLCFSRWSKATTTAHPAQITAFAQHLVSLQQVISHQLADLVLSLPASLDHLHLRLGWRLPFEVFVICRK